MRKRLFKYLLAIVLIFTFFCTMFAKNVNASTETTGNVDKIHFINAGRADSMLIESQGEFGLVDTAEKRKNVYKYLEQVMGNRKLKFIVLTHSHADHTGGFQDIVDRFVDSNTTIYFGENTIGYKTDLNIDVSNPKSQIDYTTIALQDALKKGATAYDYAIDENDNSVYTIGFSYNNGTSSFEKAVDTSAGNDEFVLNNFTIKILNREKDLNVIDGADPNSDNNRNSLLEFVTHTPSGKTALLTGDLEKDDEHRFLCTDDVAAVGECRSTADKNLITNIDIFKLGHHGSITSNVNEFLDLVNPKTAIVTLNRFENIEDVTLSYEAANHLEANNADIYMTSYDDADGHDFDDEDDSKKALLINFTNNDYSVTDAVGNSVERFIPVEDTSNLNSGWIEIKYYDQTGYLYYYPVNNNLYKGMYAVKNDGVRSCYYFAFNGIMQTGWLNYNNKMYYYSPEDGKRLLGDQTIDGKSYTFESTPLTSGTICGADYGYLMTEGLINTEGNDFYYNERVIDGEDEYYSVATGWKTIDDNRYYFDPNNKGLMVRDEFKNIEDEGSTYRYYFDEDGVMKTGWIEKDGNKYYADENGHLFTRTHDIDSNRYYFDSSTGAMYLGFHEIGDYTYYFNENNNSGELIKGFFKVGDNWYYSNSNTGRLRFTCFKVESLQICPDSSGVLQNFNGIVQKPDESSCSNPIYNGKSQSVVINSKEGFTYNDNMQTNPGVYPVTASLSDGYIWNDNTVSDVTFDCSLQKGDINNSSISVANQKYTGQPLTPDVNVSMNYNNLIKNIDYTVSYSNNTNMGIGEITVNGKGNYVGSKTISFKIVEDNELNIHAIGNHLQNGDATLLESNGEYLLMDALTPNDYQILEDYLLSEGVTHLSIYISHYHNDHYGGLVNLIDSGKFNIDKVYFPKTDYMCNWKDIDESVMRYYNDTSIVFKKIKESNIQYEFIWPTNTSYDNHCFDIDENNYINKISVGSAIVNIIGPVSELDSLEPNINNRSLISKVVIGETKFITAGDIETSVEDNMRESGVDLTADIMKLNHHGVSTTHNSRAFTNRVNPKYAFFTKSGESNFDNLNSLVKYVSSGSSNYPDNPNSFRGANLYSDSLNGNIVFSIKNDEITVSPEKNYNTITLNYINSINGDVIASNTYKYATGYYYHINYSTEIDGYTYVSSDEIPSDGIISENKAYSLYYNPIIISKTITFHANNGTDTTKTQSIEDNKNTKLSKNTFTRSGYIFKEWNTKADGTGTKYTDEQTVKLTSDLNLYAQWIDLSASISVTHSSINFGEVYNDFQNYIYRTVTIKNTGNVDVKLSINNPTSSGPFGSLSFDNDKVLKPNEEYVATLIVNPNGTYHNVVGSYNGIYQITGTYINDDNNKATVDVSANLEIKKVPQSVSYTTHVQNIGWQDYVKNGAMAGTEGLRFRLEAIQIRLTGEMAEHYDVYYRVHAQYLGWMDWAKNDEMAGTSGFGYRLEGIEIVLVEKGGTPPKRANQNYDQPYLKK